MNKLCTQFYDLTPIECKQNKAINPNHLKAIDINKNWYISQIKFNCYNVNAGKEISELLMQLEYEDLESLMNSDEFNVHLLKECLKLAKNPMNGSYLTEESHFFKASVNYLMKQIKNMMKQLPPNHQVNAYYIIMLCYFILCYYYVLGL